MGLFNLAKLFGITIRESATDGSDFTNPDADYRRLFLGEDGQLHVKDAAGAVTDIGTPGGVTVQDEGSPLATLGTTLDFVGAGVTASGTGAVKTITVAGGGGGGGGGYSYLLDVPPSSPHAQDDEFPGTSLDGKWTNPLSSGAGLDLTLAVENGWLIFEPATSGGGSTGKRGMWGIRQAAPAGSFTISAKVMNIYPGSNDDVSCGLYVARTASTLMHTVGGYVQGAYPPGNYRAIASASYSESADTGGYDGFHVDDAAGSPYLSWFKMQWDAGAGTITFYFSTNGVTWRLITSRASMSQPDRIGLAIYSNGTAVVANHQLACNWFRVTEP